MVCELSGRGATDQAVRLLREHRPGLETLLLALEAESSPYAHVVAAVLATLPPLTERERARIAPPAGGAGLESYGMPGAWH